MKRRLQKGMAYFACLLMVVSMFGSRLDYVFAEELQEDVTNKAVFYVSGKVTENGKNLTKQVNKQETLYNLNDGILYQLKVAEEVIKSDKSEGSKFISEDKIYSKTSYQMAATENQYSGILVAENDVKVSGQTNQLCDGIWYSKNGNIIISGNSVELNGLIYAPNGDVEINCESLTVKGCIVCNNITVNVKDMEYQADNHIDVTMHQLAEYQMSPYTDIIMYYHDEEQKIGIEDIEAQKIDLYIRYDNTEFKKVSRYQNGDLFEPPEPGKYFEAYAEIIDVYGEKRISNIETFQCSEEGYFSEVCKDTDEDGIPDGYEIRDNQGDWKKADSAQDSINDEEDLLLYHDKLQDGKEYLDQEIIVRKDTFRSLKECCGNVLQEQEAEGNSSTVTCHYPVKAGDGIDIYYNRDGQKVISVYNIIQEKQKLECIDDTYTIYFYDIQGQVLVKLAFDGVNQIYNEYTYGKKGIKTIEHNGMKYHFRYDGDGRVKDFIVNGNSLMSTEWKSDQKCVKTLANGYQYILEYDEIGDLTKLSAKEGVLYEWNYDPAMHYQLVSSKDHVNGQEYTYQYDEDGEVCAVSCDNGYTFEKKQEGMDWTSVTGYGDTSQTETYRMEGEDYIYQNDSVQEIRNDTSSEISYQGNRIYGKKVSKNSDTDMEVKTGNETRKYVYNAQNLLSEVWLDGKLLSSYEYNNVMELVRENSAAAEKTFLYHYDEGGNLLSVVSYPLDFEQETSLLEEGTNVGSYEYDDQFTDQMISYQGNLITYDQAGNPLKYWNGYKLSWNQGQKLESIETDSGKTLYSYDMDGNRVKKIENGKEKSFIYQNGNLICESSSDGEIWYHYDAYGDLVFMERDGEKYFYKLDELKNVLGLFDTKGKEIVQYQYDGWGKLIKLSGNEELGRTNPFRYRSYYYDEESDFYSLKNRYYDPELKRMINMDSYTDTEFGMFSHNMYAYCENTPVNTSNYTGNLPSWVTKLPKKSKSGKNYFWKNTSDNYGINCYGYAVGISGNVDPGIKCGYSFGWTVESIGSVVVADYKKRGYGNCQIFSSTVAKGLSSRWVVIALKIGTTSNKTKMYHDYHFMKRKFDEGEFWAHKPYHSGILIYKNGAFSSGSWNGDVYDGGWTDSEYTYNSSTCFIGYTAYK